MARERVQMIPRLLERDCRISSIFASLGSALICLRVTGRSSARTGSTFTDTQSESLGSGAASRTIRMIPITERSSML